MKRIQHLWLIGLGILACLAYVMGSLPITPVYAQSVDSYGFTVYTYIDYAGGNIYASSYIDSDYTEINIFSSDAIWEVDGPNYYDSGVGESLSSGPVTGGNTYYVTFSYDVEYDYYDDDEYNPNCALYNWCDGDAYPSGGGSIDIPYPPATVTNISPSDWIAGQSYQGVQITGTGFGSTPSVTLSDSAVQITRQAYNTSTSNGTSTTYIDVSVSSGTPSEPVTVTITPGSNGSPFASGTGGSLSGSSTANVIGAQQNACPSDTDATSGFSSIISTGLAIGGSGSMTVSFSHGSYNSYGVTVPYGPYSTPESIASHLAALITKQYAHLGLTAQAYGASILYKSLATLGNPSFTSSTSFTANASPQSCPPVSINFRLVPVFSAQEPAYQTTILHNVWRLVTLKGDMAPMSYRVFEHIPYQRDGTEPDGSGGYQSPLNSDPRILINEFNDGIGCQNTSHCATNPPTPPYWQKFTIKQLYGVGPNLGIQVPVMARIHGQDFLVITIHEHGYAAPTINDYGGPLPISHDPYPQSGVYSCYFCQ